MFRVPVPKGVDPSSNATVPVGPWVPVTVAVNVTAEPKVEGFELDMSVAVVEFGLAAVIVCVSTEEVLLPLNASPL